MKQKINSSNKRPFQLAGQVLDFLEKDDPNDDDTTSLHGFRDKMTRSFVILIGILAEKNVLSKEDVDKLI